MHAGVDGLLNERPEDVRGLAQTLAALRDSPTLFFEPYVANGSASLAAGQSQTFSVTSIR